MLKLNPCQQLARAWIRRNKCAPKWDFPWGEIGGKLVTNPETGHLYWSI